MAFLSYDIYNFAQSIILNLNRNIARQKNLYENLNIPRNATNDQVNKVCDLMLAHLKERDESLMQGNLVKESEFNLTLFNDTETIEDVRHLLLNPILRDIYDKKGIFNTVKQFQEANGQYPINIRYLSSLEAATSYFLFFIMIFFITEKHVSVGLVDTCLVSVREVSLGHVPSGYCLPGGVHEFPKERRRRQRDSRVFEVRAIPAESDNQRGEPHFDEILQQLLPLDLQSLPPHRC